MDFNNPNTELRKSYVQIKIPDFGNQKKKIKKGFIIFKNPRT